MVEGVPVNTHLASGFRLVASVPPQHGKDEFSFELSACLAKKDTFRDHLFNNSFQPFAEHNPLLVTIRFRYLSNGREALF